MMEKLCELLKSREMWDIASALRGPDYCAEQLKWIFTARLRTLVGLGGEVGETPVDVRKRMTIYVEEILQAAEEARQWRTDTMFGFNHWLSHVHKAILAIWKEMRKQGINNAVEKELVELLQLLNMLEDYAFDKLSLEEFAMKAKKLTIVEG